MEGKLELDEASSSFSLPSSEIFLQLLSAMRIDKIFLFSGSLFAFVALSREPIRLLDSLSPSPSLALI